MKTVILIHNVRPHFYGGAEDYQVRLARELQKNQVKPIIITSSRPLLEKARKAHIISISAPFCKIQNWSSWRNLLAPLYILWQLRLYVWYRSVFKKYQPLAINIQSRDDFISATWAARRQKIKVLWTDHSDFRVWIMQNVQVRFKNFIGKWILRTVNKANKIIFISDFECNFFKKLVAPCQPKNLVVIKNGAEDQVSEYAKIKPTPASFCHVGRIEKIKGIDELLTAFREVNATHPRAVLNIYGIGDEGLIKKIQKTENAFYHGFTNEPLHAISESEYFVLDSYHEGLSLSLVDAAMLGRGVIASNIDGNPEVVIDGKTGLLVPPRNAKALAAAMNQLLDNPVFSKRLSKNLRHHYEEHFDFSKTIREQFVPLLEEKNGRA